MPVPDQYGFFIDPSRCIGCQACVQACSECDTHKGMPMIHLEYIDRAYSTQTMPMVCMHCETPTCAEVCPADAIKKGEDGVVRSALKARCLGCNNCVLACPFGVPKMNSEFDLMMKCDLCYDRTSIGKKPMWPRRSAPPGRRFSAPARKCNAKGRSAPTNRFQFGGQTIATKVYLLAPLDGPPPLVDVTASMYDAASDKAFALDRMEMTLFETDEER